MLPESEFGGKRRDPEGKEEIRSQNSKAKEENGSETFKTFIPNCDPKLFREKRNN